MMGKLLALNWGDFSSHISEAFYQIWTRKQANDVTLVCDDGEVGAHKLVLMAGSDFFNGIFCKIEQPQPILYLKGIEFRHLKKVVEFMYKGERELQPRVPQPLFLAFAADFLPSWSVQAKRA